MQTFQDDDVGYRQGLWSHLNGYVVNAQRGSNPGEPILHKATCDTITPTPDREWTKDYIKVCSTNRYELDAWARSHELRFSSCVACDP
jgi:hypothetical protein